MNITLSVSKIQLPRLKVDEFQKLFSRELQNTSARLRQNISGGSGADGQAIKPSGYSPSYLDAISKGRVRAGKSGVRKTSTTVNLQISGELLNSMQVKDTPNGAELFFLGGHYSGLSAVQLASVLHDRGFEHWFEYGKEDIARIEKRAIELVEKQLK